MLSNLSYMKRVMILILPTDWSPKNTSLYFAKANTRAIFFVPTSDLYHCYSTTSRFFKFRASKTGISYRITSPRRTELSWVEFSYRKIWVCCLAREMVMFSWLRICDRDNALLRAFLFYFFGFYNFIWGTPLLAIVILFGFSWMRGLINAWI